MKMRKIIAVNEDIEAFDNVEYHFALGCVGLSPPLTFRLFRLRDCAIMKNGVFFTEE